jgi:carboxypeptidase Q
MLFGNHIIRQYNIDSWDTGSQTGVNDDGGGFLSFFEAMRLIKNNLPKPQRTIRFIAWSV